MGLKGATYCADDSWDEYNWMLGTQPTLLNRLAYCKLQAVVVKFPRLRNVDTVLEPTPFILYK